MSQAATLDVVLRWLSKLSWWQCFALLVLGYQLASGAWWLIGQLGRGCWLVWHGLLAQLQLRRPARRRRAARDRAQLQLGDWVIYTPLHGPPTLAVLHQGFPNDYAELVLVGPQPPYLFRTPPVRYDEAGPPGTWRL